MARSPLTWTKAVVRRPTAHQLLDEVDCAENVLSPHPPSLGLDKSNVRAGAFAVATLDVAHKDPDTRSIIMHKREAVAVLSYTPIQSAGVTLLNICARPIRFEYHSAECMRASMATLKAANPAQPIPAAEGPCLTARTAPVAQPERPPLTTSCFPRAYTESYFNGKLQSTQFGAFSKRQSHPEKRAVMTAKDLQYQRAFSPRARQAILTWVESGTVGIMRPPGPIGTVGSAPRIPKKRPIMMPTPPPRTTPVVA